MARPKGGRLAAVMLGLPLCLATLATLDRLVMSRLVAPTPFPPPMPPSVRVEFRTSEFGWDLETNNLGLRERDLEPSPAAGVMRVLAIGDSFTLGWGVAVHESWVRLLEQRLRRDGLAVQVINAGKAGMATEYYAQAAETMVPVFRPELVVLGITQGDDLAQAIPPERPHTRDRGLGRVQSAQWKKHLESVASIVCPNLVRWRHAGRPSASRERTTTRVTWDKDVADRLATASDRERAWFEHLDPAVQRRFREGHLNPGLVTLALAQPDHLRMTLHPADEKTARRIAAMGEHLARVRDVCARYHARAVVCPIPCGPFVDRRQWDAVRRIGFQVEDDFLTSSLPDDVVGQVAERTGLASLSSMRLFRERAKERPLYFHWDGHLNRAGHQLLADSLAPAVEAYLRRLVRGAGPRDPFPDHPGRSGRQAGDLR